MADKVRIVTRADDLGSFASANRAIYDAYKQGVLRNASLIVPAAHFEQAAEMFAPEKDFCVGMHSCITCEWDNVRWKPLLPVEKVRSIVESDGTFKRHATAIHEGGAVFAEIMAELQAQLDLARSKGLTIAYVDAHMAFPWLFEESDEHRLCEVMQKWAQKEGLIYAGWGNTLGFKRLPELQGEKGDPLQSLAERINAAEPGTYLVVTHPMYDDEEARKANHGKNEPGEVARSRDMQRRMFMDPVILKAYKEKQAEPIRYIDAFSA